MITPTKTTIVYVLTHLAFIGIAIYALVSPIVTSNYDIQKQIRSIPTLMQGGVGLPTVVIRNGSNTLDSYYFKECLSTNIPTLNISENVCVNNLDRITSSTLACKQAMYALLIIFTIIIALALIPKLLGKTKIYDYIMLLTALISIVLIFLTVIFINSLNNTITKYSQGKGKAGNIIDDVYTANLSSKNYSIATILLLTVFSLTVVKELVFNKTFHSLFHFMRK
jgi:hypothetical protein